METINEIESAVSRLSAKELTEFRAWFASYDAERWDSQFEEDVRAGKLDALAQKAVADFRVGKYRELRDISPYPIFGLVIRIYQSVYKSWPTKIMSY